MANGKGTKDGLAERAGRPRARRGAPSELPAAPRRAAFRRRLLGWYRENGRDLPWRRADDPYQVLVSEIMLQQTQVHRVLPKYVEWLERYPSLQALADAPLAEVVRAWYPLGYNIRPRRLHLIAREAVARYDGKLPEDEGTLLGFPGIGPYTAGAIRSFAFGRRAAILDTNVARVLFRVFVAAGDARSHQARKRLWAISRALLPRKHVFDFNQGLMDLGATVCTARRPRCPACPLRTFCLSSLSRRSSPRTESEPEAKRRRNR
jgi:A/G-specific adenine glycosylase